MMNFTRKLDVPLTTEDLTEKQTKHDKRLKRLFQREVDLTASRKRWERRFNRAKNALKKIHRAQKHVRKTLDLLTANH